MQHTGCAKPYFRTCVTHGQYVVGLARLVSSVPIVAPPEPFRAERELQRWFLSWLGFSKLVRASDSCQTVASSTTAASILQNLLRTWIWMPWPYIGLRLHPASFLGFRVQAVQRSPRCRASPPEVFGSSVSFQVLLHVLVIGQSNHYPFDLVYDDQSHGIVNDGLDPLLSTEAKGLEKLLNGFLNDVADSNQLVFEILLDSTETVLWMTLISNVNIASVGNTILKRAKDFNINSVNITFAAQSDTAIYAGGLSINSNFSDQNWRARGSVMLKLHL